MFGSDERWVDSHETVNLMTDWMFDVDETDWIFGSDKHFWLCQRCFGLSVETLASPVKQTASFRIKNAKCHLHPKLRERAEDGGKQIGPGEKA